MSKIGLSLLQQGPDATDQLNYFTRLPDGRLIKSSTILLRTADERVVGAVCINLDVTEMRLVGRLISEFAGESNTTDAPITTFSNDIDTIIDDLLNEAEHTLGQSLSSLTIDSRVELFDLLEKRGLFQIRRAVPRLAERLGMSRASVYNYVARLRAGKEQLSQPVDERS